jgi:hypothetical protein
VLVELTLKLLMVNKHCDVCIEIGTIILIVTDFGEALEMGNGEWGMVH